MLGWAPKTVMTVGGHMVGGHNAVMGTDAKEAREDYSERTYGER